MAPPTSAATPASTACWVIWGRAAPPVLELVGAETPLLSDAAAEAPRGSEEEDAAAWVGCAALLPPVVKAASFSRPAVMVTAMNKSAVSMSVMVSVDVPGSLASGPSAIMVQTAVCCSIWQFTLSVLSRGG